MKKSLLASLVLIPALLLGACSSTSEETTSEETKEKVYRVGVDTTYPPFEFEENGEYKGIDIELIKEIAKEEGFEIELKPMDFGGIIPSLQADQLDVAIAGMSITDERKKVVDFTNPYFDAGLILVVNEKDTTIKTVDDLKGKKVAVKSGTSGAKFAMDLANEKGFEIVQFDDSPSMFQDVANGNSDVLIEDYPVIAYAIAQKDLGLKMVGDRLNGDQYGIAVLKGENQDLLKKLNSGLETLKENGKYDEIVNKYIGK